MDWLGCSTFRAFRQGNRFGDPHRHKVRPPVVCAGAVNGWMPAPAGQGQREDMGITLDGGGAGAPRAADARAYARLHDHRRRDARPAPSATIAAVFTVLDRVADRLRCRTAHPESVSSRRRRRRPAPSWTGSSAPRGEFYLQYKEALAPARGRRDLQHLHSTRYGSATASSGSAWRVASTSLYSTLGRAARARPPARGLADETRVVVISDALWRSWFGADPSVVGRAYRSRAQRRTVVGVMRPEFQFPERRRRSGVVVIEVRRREACGPGGSATTWWRRMAPGDRPSRPWPRSSRRWRAALPERFGGLAGLRAADRAAPRRGAPAARRDAGPGRTLAVDPVRGRRHRAADRLRQRGQPLHGARGGRQRDLAVRRAIGRLARAAGPARRWRRRWSAALLGGCPGRWCHRLD